MSGLEPIGFIAGLIVGWNFLPQPSWVKDFVDKIRGKFNK